jgi:hypothetical protein
MRTVDATLTAAHAAGQGTPFIKAYVGYTTGSVKTSHTVVHKYILTGTKLEFWVPTFANYGTDQECIWLERGLTINGTTYTVTTGRFYIWNEEYLPDGSSHFVGGLFPHQYYSAAGDDTYENVINAFCTAWGKTAVYLDDTEAWLGYQFLPAGQVVIMNSAMRFLNMLKQKRLITVCDNGSEEVLIYSADILQAHQATYVVKDEFAVFTSQQRRRQYIWKDENQTLRQDGDLEDPVHNLGYLESTDDPPSRNFSTFEAVAYLRPDLHIQDGDSVKLMFYNSTRQVQFFAKPTEEWDSKSTKLPKWRLKLEANPVFENTEGGALPSTIERVSNYTPLNTGSFDGILSSSDNNLQAAMETLDNHVGHLHPEVSTLELFSVANVTAASAFTGTIATLPGGAVLTYNPVTGSELNLVPGTTTAMAKLRLYNTTRGTYALIANCVAATNTITLTANVPAGWTVGDTIDIASPTVTLGFSWIDLELTAGPYLRSHIAIATYVQTGTLGNIFGIHPTVAFSAPKANYNIGIVINQVIPTFNIVPLTGSLFSITWNGAFTSIILREQGFFA